MENKIKVLPESVANQIAAGEVVQRPSSAVKELLENAIDAGANSIILNIKDAGKNLIQVIDNGQGMNEIDARLSIERHATSKISKVEDIFHISTMGFRGEALASIAAVSQFELKTKTDEDELATLIKMNGSKVENQSLEAGKTGTTISIKNLFFNVPARRNFLKSTNVENRHINDVFQQVALGNPDVAFSLINSGEEMFRLERSNFKQRIMQLFGKRFNERLVPINEETDIVKISGFVCKPEFATSKRSEQFFLVNKRFIKSPYLHHAVLAAFEDLLAKEMHPPYFICLEINPDQIDVNIHPTKTEIKFLEERSIYAILRTTIRQSLGRFNIAPSLDFERETAFDDVNLDKNRSISMPEIKVDKEFNPFGPPKSVIKPSKHFMPESKAQATELYNLESVESDNAKQVEVPLVETKQSDIGIDEGRSKSNIIQLHNKFILTHLKSGFMIIDQHRAHLRILYDKMVIGKSNSTLSQALLFPVLIELSQNESSTLKQIQTDLEKLGFSIEDFGQDSVSINGLPAGMDEKEVKTILPKILDDYHVSGEKKSGTTIDKLTFMLASSMSIKSGQKLQEREMESLIDQLFACEMPHSLPNGKPIIITLSLDELGKKFQY